MNGVVHALNIDDGTEEWRFDTGVWLFSLALEDGILYFGSSDWMVRAVDAASGDVIWERPHATRPLRLSVIRGTLYIGGEFYMAAHEATDGSEIWRFDSGYVTNSPGIADGLVYFGDNRNRLYAVEADTGEERWRFPVGESRFQGIVSSPAIVQNAVYFGSYDNNIYAVGAKSGTKLWSYNTGIEITGSPAVVGQRLYIGGRLSGLIALGRQPK